MFNRDNHATGDFKFDKIKDIKKAYIFKMLRKLSYLVESYLDSNYDFLIDEYM